MEVGHLSAAVVRGFDDGSFLLRLALQPLFSVSRTFLLVFLADYRACALSWPEIGPVVDATGDAYFLK